MIVLLSIKKFRNHADVEFGIDSPLVVVIGQNAKGKTNLIEAVYVAMTGGGFRANDGRLINNESERSRVTLNTNNTIRTVDLNKHGAAKTFSINQRVVPTQKAFAKSGPIVLFEPEELRMLTGPPDLRRSWLDTVLSETTTDYEQTLAHYQRALRQRNRLLKTGATAEDQYFVWELKLSEYGQRIVATREKLFEELNSGVLTDLYKQISGGSESVTVEYLTPDGDYSTWLAGSLRLRREHDQRLGHTTLGPHREDFSILRNETSLLSTGSRGEVRSAVLALKLFEVQLIERVKGIKPVLLLDDVLSELDVNRQKALMNAIKGCQSFITATAYNAELFDGLEPQVIEL